MLSTPSYAYEKVYHAVRNLAAGSGNLRSRLRDAYMPHLRDLQLRQIPWAPVQERFEDLLELLVAAISPDDAVSSLVSETDLVEIARGLVDLSNRVHERYVLQQHGLG